MKKCLRTLELKIPTIDILESRRIIGGYTYDGGMLGEVIIDADRDTSRPDSGFDPREDTQIEDQTEDQENDMDTDQNGYVSNLTSAEELFILQHPVAALNFKENADQAFSITMGLYPDISQHNTIADAFRHTLWCALNTISEGVDLAREFGNAHETNPNQPADEKNMDLHNNEVGYEIGLEAIEKGWELDQIIEAIDQAIKDGKLETLK